MQEYRIIIGVSIIVLGLFIAFFGTFFSNIIVFVVGFLATTALLLILLYSLILGPKVKKWLAWLIFSLSILIGLVVGFLFTKTERLYSVLISACAGFLIGVLLDESVLYLLGSQILFWSVNVGFAVLFGALALWWFDIALILSTSLIGSFLTARGVSLLAGGWTNEFTLINQIKSGGVQHMEPWFYAYLSGILVLTTLSSAI